MVIPPSNLDHILQYPEVIYRKKHPFFGYSASVDPSPCMDRARNDSPSSLFIGAY